ncbi:MAG: cytochrome c [Crocinitomicaceae bacterium]|nr:cytochrome c [Crocinitomicaceae bacterium]
MKKLTFFVGTTFFVLACSPKTTEAVVETVTEAEVVAPTIAIAQGKTIYDSKCQGCHNLKKVGDYNATQWSKILPNMARQANLSDEQTALVDQYINWEITK